MSMANKIENYLQFGMLTDLKGSKVTIFEKEQTQPFSPYTRRNYYKMTLTKVKGRLKYGEQLITIDKPSLIFFNPLIPYACEIESGIENDWVCQLCAFSPDFISSATPESVFQDSPFFYENPIITLNESDFDSIHLLFDKMLNEFNSEYQHKYDLVRQYLFLILHHAIKIHPNPDTKIYNNAALRISSQFVDLLERQFPIDSPDSVLALKTPQNYADKLAVHVNHLNRSVKTVLHKTTTEVITARVIQEAKSLLQFTDWSITDISFSLGFEYPSYFDNFFKKHTGITPSSVRIKNV